MPRLDPHHSLAGPDHAASFHSSQEGTGPLSSHGCLVTAGLGAWLPGTRGTLAWLQARDCYQPFQWPATGTRQAASESWGQTKPKPHSLTVVQTQRWGKWQIGEGHAEQPCEGTDACGSTQVSVNRTFD